MGQNIKSLAVCVCVSVCVCVCVCAQVLGAEYLENGQRQRFGYNGTPIGNDIWRIDWSRER